MKIVFLDIDGVLVNLAALRAGRIDNGHCRFDAKCVERLNHITDATGAAIVVSSNWRRFHGDMTDVLKRNGVTGLMVGETPDLRRERPSGIQVAVERGEEIQAWLDDHLDIRSFVILDDDRDMGNLLPKLIQTDPVIGLTDANARKTITLLTGPLYSEASW